jgi:hypothetical protein
MMIKSTTSSLEVADAGHMVAGDRNDVFGQAAREFLRRNPSGFAG